MAAARRVYLYVMAFAGLMVSLYAIAGMLAVLVAQPVLQSSALLGASDLRSRTSLYLAELVVGVPIWLGHWLVAERFARRSPEEREAPERRLFLAAVFGVTAVVALFALRGLLRAVLTLPGAPTAQPLVLAAITTGARLLVFGAACFGYARLRAATIAPERDRREHDAAYDLAIYALAGFALAFLLTGVGQAVRQVLLDLLQLGRPRVLVGAAGAPWTVWGPIAAWLLAGGAVWAPVWQYDLARGGRRELRVAYLYIVLVVAVPATLGAAAFGLYEVLRRLFGYRPAGGDWDFLPNVLPVLLAGGLAWAHHWAVMRRQAALAAADTLSAVTASELPARPAAAVTAGGGEARPAEVAGAIPWPRRPALALLALAGLATAAPAFVSLLWLGLDYLLNTGTALAQAGWWRDRLSAGIAAGLVGAAAWLGAWAILQRAAAADPARERTADARRRLLGFVTIAGALFAIGFLVAVLWLAFRAVLGDSPGPTGLSRALKELSGAIVAALLATYHGLVLRRDLRLGGPMPGRVRVIALVAPGVEGALAGLRERSGLRIEVAGHLTGDEPGGQLDLATLQERVAALGADGHGGRALLVLHSDGGRLYHYRK